MIQKIPFLIIGQVDPLESRRQTTIDECRLILNRMAHVIDGHKVAWNSRLLSDVTVKSSRRASDIVKAAFTQEKLRNEIAAEVKDLGGLQSPKLWNKYFILYDKVEAFSDGYLQLIAWADRELPTCGTICDFGTGTGNFASILYGRSTDRQVIGVDLSPFGLRLAKAKLSELADGETKRFKLIQANLLSLKGQIKNRLDGAVMNNVLFVLPEEKRRTVLETVYNALSPGKKFILSDPRPIIQNSSQEWQKRLTKVITSALKNSYLTEYDIALYAYINHQLLMGESPPILSLGRLIALAKSIGFEVERIEPGANYDISNFLVLKKPAWPQMVCSSVMY